MMKWWRKRTALREFAATDGLLLPWWWGNGRSLQFLFDWRLKQLVKKNG